MVKVICRKTTVGMTMRWSCQAWEGRSITRIADKVGHVVGLMAMVVVVEAARAGISIIRLELMRQILGIVMARKAMVIRAMGR